MNLERLEELAQWLEAGAPHVHINMNYGLVIQSQDPDLYYEALGDGEDCGTVCCIAGAAVFLWGDTDIEDHWDDVKPQAIKLLGFSNPEDYTFGHPLFKPPGTDVTPNQAAAAVRRVMAGEEPWDV